MIAITYFYEMSMFRLFFSKSKFPLHQDVPNSLRL